MTIGLPHFSHLCSVGLAVTTALPSALRFIVVLHSGYPEQPRNGPRRLHRWIIGLPQLGQVCSVSLGSGSPSRGLMYLHGGSSFHPEQPTKLLPVLRLNWTTSGLPHFGHLSPVSCPRRAPMFVLACARSSENGPQNSLSTSAYFALRSAISSSSSSKCDVNFTSITFGKCCTRRSVTVLPISEA